MGCPQIQQGGSPLRMAARCRSRIVVLRMSPHFGRIRRDDGRSLRA